MSKQNADSEGPTRINLSRRQMLKTVGAGAGVAAVGLPSHSQKALAQDDGDDDAWWEGTLKMSAAPSVAIVGRVMDFVHGDSNEAEVAALQQAAFNLAQSKKKEIESTITLNENIDLLISEWAMTEGKIAAVNAIDAGKTASEVKADAKQAADVEIAKVQENLINSGVSSTETIYNLFQQAESAENVSPSDVLVNYNNGDGLDTIDEYADQEVTLVDGRTVNDKKLKTTDTGGNTETVYATVRPTSTADTYAELNTTMVAKGPDGTLQYFQPNTKNMPSDTTILMDIWEQILTTRDTVAADLEVFVDKSIEEIQDGNLRPGDLLGPDEMVRTITEDEPRVRAIAELRALNIAADWNHGAKIELQSIPVDIFNGTVGVSDPSVKDSLNQGDTIDPSNYSATFYINYPLTDVIADWSANYDDSKEIDGGVLHIEKLPDPSIEKWLGNELEFVVSTSYNETATFAVSELSEVDVNGTTKYEVDLSDQLENDIAEVVTLSLYSQQEQVAYVNRIVDQPFTISEIEGANTLKLERERDLQTDDNYRTEDEWDQTKDQLDKTQDEIQESVGGGWFDGDLFGDLFGWLPKLPGLGVVESAVVVVVGSILGLLGLSAASG